MYKESKHWPTINRRDWKTLINKDTKHAYFKRVKSKWKYFIDLKNELLL